MMEHAYNIKGISFEIKNLNSIDMDSLRVNTFSESHLFYLTTHKKPFLILRANDLIDEAFIQTWKARGIKKLYSLNIFPKQDLQQFKEAFQKLKNQKDEFEREKACASLLKLFEETYLNAYNQTSFYGLVTLLRSEFVTLDASVVAQHRKNSFLIHSRSEVVATLSVVCALYLGYTDYYLLRDLYYSCYFGDVGILNNYFDFSILEGLKNKHSKQEITLSQRQILEKHPQLSESKVLGSYKRLYTYPELIYLIGRHHILSKINSMGIALVSEYSDLDLIPAFFEEVVPFEEMIYFSGDFSIVNKWIQSTPLNFSLVKIIQSFFIPSRMELKEKESA
jgi:hypothetical protein